MTIRTLRGMGALEIKSEPHEDSAEVEAAYREELHRLGHEVVRDPNAFVSDYRLRCTRCFMTARVYHVKHVVAIFSDFGENYQCPSRQMNILNLITCGTNTWKLQSRATGRSNTNVRRVDMAKETFQIKIGAPTNSEQVFLEWDESNLSEHVRHDWPGGWNMQLYLFNTFEE
jgi:hypothetical protein